MHQYITSHREDLTQTFKVLSLTLIADSYSLLHFLLNWTSLSPIGFVHISLLDAYLFLWKRKDHDHSIFEDIYWSFWISDIHCNFQTAFYTTHFTFTRHFLSKATYFSVFRLYIFCQCVCSLGIEPTTFALLTQCSTTEPQEHDLFLIK